MQKTFEGFGYSPEGERVRRTVTPPALSGMPASAYINSSFLPPVGRQDSDQHPGRPGSCCAWATTYGLATWYAAAHNSLSPTSDPNNQASPAHIYIQVLAKEGYKGTCGDTKFSDYFDILEGKGKGVVSMAQAPYTACCKTLWTDYKDLPANPAFLVKEVTSMWTYDLSHIKTCIAWGLPVVFAMRLYDNWFTYGSPDNCAIPYVGDNLYDALHCMLIIGYSEEYKAFLVQNSQGNRWGTNIAGAANGADCGYVWISYASFQEAAEPTVYFVPPTDDFQSRPVF